MEYATEKWGGRPHYRGAVHVLGDDECGTWIWGPAGRTIRRGEQPLFQTQQDALALVVPNAWWCPTWWVEHPEIEIYINIGTPHVWEEERVTSVDLDLDVIRYCDGRVEIVDRDEFESHQLAFGYPSDVVATADRAAVTALELLSAGSAPFDGAAAQRWVELARASGLVTTDSSPA